MDLFIVIIIVAAAIYFTIRKFIKNYKEQDGCGSGCSCPSKRDCNQNFEPFKTL